jgi:hypothetical protein
LGAPGHLSRPTAGFAFETISQGLRENGGGGNGWDKRIDVLGSVMAIFNEFGIFPVVRGINGKLMVQKEVAFPSEEDAKRAGQIFADVLGGAVAFRRVDDSDAGVVGQGIIIGKYGLMARATASPDEL